MNIIGALWESQKFVNTTTKNIKKLSKHISFASAIILWWCAWTSAAAESSKSDIQNNIYNWYYYDDSDQKTQDLWIDEINDSIRFNMSSSNKMFDDSFSYPPNFEPTQATKIREIPVVKYDKWQRVAKNNIADILAFETSPIRVWPFEISPICSKTFTWRREQEIGIISSCEKERKVVYAGQYTPPVRWYQTYIIDGREITKTLQECKLPKKRRWVDWKRIYTNHSPGQYQHMTNVDRESIKLAYINNCYKKRPLRAIIREWK